MIECRVLYEKGGRSTGTAQVIFQRVADAKRARDEYNNVPLAGREMVNYFPEQIKLYYLPCLYSQDLDINYFVNKYNVDKQDVYDYIERETNNI